MLAPGFAAPAGAESLVVYTVNYPLEYFAARVGGERVDARFPGPADQDPAFWEPEPDAIIRYHDADLILLNGAGYAKWIAYASLPRRKLVDTSASFADSYIRVADNVVHSHGPKGDHSHAGVAFTTWLDPTQAAAQARATAEAMARTSPDDADAYRAGLAALEADLDDIDERLAQAFSRLGDRALLASHPVYQYLARRYGLELRSVVWEPDSMPVEGEWRVLESLLGQQQARWMLWEAEPLPEIRDRLAAMGVQPIVFRPVMNRPGDGDFLSIMRENADAVGRAADATRKVTRSEIGSPLKIEPR